MASDELTQRENPAFAPVIGDQRRNEAASFPPGFSIGLRRE
jgi:hypothetical protein